MVCRIVQVAPPVNESEKSAFASIMKAAAEAPYNTSDFLLVTNLMLARGISNTSDEIDAILIGPQGVVVIEVKHWSWDNVWDKKRNRSALQDAVHLIEKKARKIKGALNGLIGETWVKSALFLTNQKALPKLTADRTRKFQGTEIWTLPEVTKLLPDDSSRAQVTAHELDRILRRLHPGHVAAGKISERTTLGQFSELKLVSATNSHHPCKVYQAIETRTREKVILNVWDLTATANAEKLAQRESDVAIKFQKSPYLPNLVLNLSDVPGLQGEVKLFAISDPDYLTVASAMRLERFDLSARLAFASQALFALNELHYPALPSGLPRLVHRDIRPETLYIKADFSPMFGGWHWARVEESQTITNPNEAIVSDEYCAPEVRRGGRSQAEFASDVYSLCKVLTELIEARKQENPSIATETIEILEQFGCALEPVKRSKAGEISELISQICSHLESTGRGEPLALEIGQRVKLAGANDEFKLAARLGGQGEHGTFRAERLDGRSLASFVIKIEEATAADWPAKLANLNRLKNSRIDLLAKIEHVATELPKRNEAHVVYRWVEARPLDSINGVLAIVAGVHLGDVAIDDPQIDKSLVDLGFELLNGLTELHAAGLIHGDISPRNILLDQMTPTLIDFDLVAEIDAPAMGVGTAPYAAPWCELPRTAHPCDDFFALGATLFRAMTAEEPFRHDGKIDLAKGLAWPDEQRFLFPNFVALLDTLCGVQVQQKNVTSTAEIKDLHDLLVKDTRSAATPTTKVRSSSDPIEPNLTVLKQPTEVRLQRTKGSVERVRQILSTYPGSRFGNAETRGLDTEFARESYVETSLDQKLFQQIRQGDVSLVILCGNAGDGKTAFLQNLLTHLGAPSLESKDRVWKGVLDGSQIEVNFDGAAAMKERSADALVDELMEPFHHGKPATNRVHLLAINDGRLIEWASNWASRNGGHSVLTEAIETAIIDEKQTPDFLRIIELNDRSLVGSYQNGKIQIEFFERLIDQIIGGQKAQEIWQPCMTCVANDRCSIKKSVDEMKLGTDIQLEAGELFRRRFAQALQAVHQNNEIHITARELKAAVSYVLFGLDGCEDIIAHDISHSPEDFAFDFQSSARQGDLLRELCKFDPGLISDARIDRAISDATDDQNEVGVGSWRSLSRAQARRRAYFRWDVKDREVKKLPFEGTMHLYGMSHFESFSRFESLEEEKKAEVCERVCKGLARLGQLPQIAEDRKDFLPIKVIPRTPTESILWSEEPLSRFRLEAEKFQSQDELEALHRVLKLIHKDEFGHEESLKLSARLFSQLLELADGEQLLGAQTDDVFANLSVYTQRLGNGRDDKFFAWNPRTPNDVFQVRIDRTGPRQTIVIEAVEQA
jgi:serine/threonine protein kinase